MTKTFDQILDEASPAEERVALCLNGRLRREHREVSERIAERDRAAAAAAEIDTRMTSKAAKPDDLDNRLAELEESMREQSIVLVLHALAAERWNELWSLHPARVGADGKRDPRDHAGINASTFYHSLARSSVVEPAMTDRQWDTFLTKINDAQFDKIATAAWLLNRRDEDVPFLLAGSPPVPNSAAS
jgi:hypothetical protein